jgi:hypothetical protein
MSTNVIADNTGELFFCFPVQRLHIFSHRIGVYSSLKNEANMKKTLFLSFLFCGSIVCTAYSQEETANRTAGKFISYTEGGVLAGNSDNVDATPFIFHSSLNWALNKRLSAGLGAGVEFLRETHLPVMANVIYRFGDKSVVNPFVRLEAGYLIALEDKTSASSGYYYAYSAKPMDASGGWLLNPSAGVIFYTKQKVGIALSAGYRHHTLHYTGENDYRVQAEYNRLSLTLGIIF